MAVALEQYKVLVDVDGGTIQATPPLDAAPASGNLFVTVYAGRWGASGPVSTITPPSGFSAVMPAGESVARIPNMEAHTAAIAYKTATGSEGNNYSVNWTTGSNVSAGLAAMYEFSGLTSPVLDKSEAAGSGTNSVTSIAHTSTGTLGASSGLAFLVGLNRLASTSGSLFIENSGDGYTETYDNGVTSGGVGFNMMNAWKEFTSNTALNSTVSSGTASRMGAMVATFISDTGGGTPHTATATDAVGITDTVTADITSGATVMATATLLAASSAGFPAGGTSFTTPSVSPGANCALVLLVADMADANGVSNHQPGVVTVSGSGPTGWTARANDGPDVGYQLQGSIHTNAIGGTDPGSFTVTWTRSGADTIGEYYYALYKITGHDTGTTFAGAVVSAQHGAGLGGSAGGGEGPRSVTLAATPASGDIVLALSAADSDIGGGATFDNTNRTWTEDDDAAADGTNVAGNIGQSTGSTSTSVQWSDVNTGAGDYSSVQMAIIVKAQPGGTTYDETVTDPIGITDTATGDVVGADSAVQTDDVGITDTVTRVHEASRIVTGAVGITDTVVSSDFPVPVSRSGRKWLDQHGDVWTLKGTALWLAPQNGSNADITTVLDDVAAAGFNTVKIALFGYRLNGDFIPFENAAGDPVFATTVNGTTPATAYQSELGAAWYTVDHLVSEAHRNGITVIMSLYSAYDFTGPRTEIQNAHTADPDNLYNFGFDLATRYAAYPNIIWDASTDDNITWPATLLSAFDKFYQGIQAAEGSTNRLWLAENANGTTSYSQWPSAFTGTGGFTYLRLDANSVYQWGGSTVEQFDAVYNQSGATTFPVWDCEPPYIGNTGAGGAANRQQVRERIYASMIRGAIGVNMGHEDVWPFGPDSPFGGEGGSITYLNAYSTSPYIADVSRAWAVLDQHVRDTAWAPTDSFVTTGTGSGDTKAAAGASGPVALAYFPSSRTIQVDTTIISGTGNVRLRWFDPTDASYTTIAASEAQQSGRSVTHPGNNSAGAGDWLLVVDLADAATVPDPVDDLDCVPDGANIDLTWTAPYDGGSAITDYNVWVGEVQAFT